jgi:amidase
MARNVYDVAVSLGIMTGIDPRDPLTTTQAGLAYNDYTPFLKKDSLKGARIGINRNFVGIDAEVDKILDRTVSELKAAGAVVIDPVNYPDYVMSARSGIMNTIRYTEFREQIHDYLSTLKPGFPKSLTEMIAKADALKEPTGRYAPNPGRFTSFKKENAGAPPTAMSYRAAKEYGMPMIRAAILGVFEENKLDAIVYTTNPAPAPVIIPPFVAPPDTPPTSGNSLTSIANLTNFPDVIVPAGVTKNKLPVTVSFFGPAYSEPKLLAYAYAYEQSTHHRVSPSTTPALPGETFEY